jgi:hypothetical protein
MTRALALSGIMLIAVPAYLCSFTDEKTRGGLDVKYRYLVVYAAGPPAWVKAHRFSLRWRGKDIALPTVFRVGGRADLEIGSPGEALGRVEIGKEKAPVSSKPRTKFQVRNTGAVAFVGEKSSRKDVAAFSSVTSVAISPPEYPGELSPNATEGEIGSSQKTLAKHLTELIASGRVIDVQVQK